MLASGLTLFQILCWGMRNMKKYQLLSITSPSVEFEIGEAVAQSPIIKNTRKNPNFSEALLFVDTVCVGFILFVR